MRYDERFLDELKGRLRLSDVIGKTVKLRRQGREYVGLSPFNKERSPSFFVNDDKGFFHDFSSGKHGDLIAFLQETERLSFAEAIERLAAEAGMALPDPDPESEARGKRRASLTDWLDMAAAWFEAELRRPGGREARAYLEGRGLGEAEWKRFGIGFSPAGRTALKDYLVTKGALPADLVASGLLAERSEGGAPYDRFSGRILFPIADARGRIVSFGGRALDPQARAKYLNGPDTDLFDKGRVLYGLAEARKLLVAAGSQGGGQPGSGDPAPALVVVEGYFDVVACQRAGIAAVAAMGTSFTEAQMDALWRLHPEPTLCFDADRAGQQAAARAIERALPRIGPSRSFRFAHLSGGKDPDDILREQGPGALKAQLAATIPMVEALFEKERAAASLETPEGRAALKQKLRAAATLIADADVAAAYRQALLEKFDALTAPAQRPGASDYGHRPAGGSGRGRRGRWGEPPPPQRALPEARTAANRLARSLDPVAAALALLAIRDPAAVDDHLEVVQQIGFGDPQLEGLAREIITLRLTDDQLDSASLRRHLASSGFEPLLNDVERAAVSSGAPFISTNIDTDTARAQWTNAFEVIHRVSVLDSAIASAKQDLAGGGGSAGLMSLKAQRDQLRRALSSRTLWTGEAG
ncbi:MAG TPA: DNA primase [Caulobacteraceae bacterium]|nr:DNA primase [Caulobacteraceae bacterium]